MQTCNILDVGTNLQVLVLESWYSDELHELSRIVMSCQKHISSITYRPTSQLRQLTASI